MCLLKKILNKRASDDDTLIKNLAKEIGYSDTPIRNFKNKPEKELDSFESLVKMVRYLEPDREIEIMIDYSNHLRLNFNTARYMLDYLSVNRQLDEMNSLIEKMKESSNKESALWAKAYSLLYLWQTQSFKLDLDKFLNEVNYLVTKNIPSLEILQRLLKCYIYDQKQYHKQVLEISEEVKFLIEKVEDNYLKRVYSVKINEITSNLKLWVYNDFDGAREDANKVIEADLGIGFTAYAKYTIAQSYFYTSYDKSREYFIDCIRLYETMNRKEVAEDVVGSLEFLEIFWDQKKQDSSFILKENELYIKAKLNIDITEDLHNFNDENKQGFILFLKGINENNTDFLFKSMIQNLKGGDAFSANAARLELQNRGFSEVVLNELIKIHDNQK